MFRSGGIRAGGKLGLLPLPVLNGERGGVRGQTARPTRFAPPPHPLPASGERGRSSVRHCRASTSLECAVSPTMKFMDTRQWIALLEKAGELRRITAQVNWDREIGAVARRVLEKKGPALLFENIKGYASGRCTKVFVSGLGARSRLALALGFPREANNREHIQYVMKKN